MSEEILKCDKCGSTDISPHGTFVGDPCYRCNKCGHHIYPPLLRVSLKSGVPHIAFGSGAVVKRFVKCPKCGHEFEG